MIHKTGAIKTLNSKIFEYIKTSLQPKLHLKYIAQVNLHLLIHSQVLSSGSHDFEHK